MIKLKNKIEKKKLNKPIISVGKYNAPIQWAFAINPKNKKLFPVDKDKQILPSQTFQPSYYDTGALAVFDSSNFNTISNVYNGNFYGFELPPEKNVDIDDLSDWQFVEKLFNK